MPGGVEAGGEKPPAIRLGILPRVVKKLLKGVQIKFNIAMYVQIPIEDYCVQLFVAFSEFEGVVDGFCIFEFWRDKATVANYLLSF